MTYIPRSLTYLDLGEDRQTVSEINLYEATPRPSIVLGEPGMGKTFLLKSIAANHHNAEYLTARALLRRQAAPSTGVTLVIDGLDELASLREQDPVQNVLSKLLSLGAPPFILSCRSADWRSVSVLEIRDEYGEAPREFSLEPLTKAEAQAFLSTDYGSDAADRIVNDLEDRNLAEFYTNPLMLQLIAQVTRDTGGLPASRAAAFLEASKLLVREQSQQHARSPLALLSVDAALDAAGAICASLILTGAEAVYVGAPGRTPPGHLALTELSTLPGAESVEAALASAIFERRDGDDRFAPFHRAIAEFLGARWIAAQIEKDGGTTRRFLAMITVNGGIPSSLRGLHAWLAHFSPCLAPQVIAADPFGLVRYGETAGFGLNAARALLEALRDLSDFDPWFQREDWGRQEVAGLTQAEMAADLRRILNDPAASVQLKSFLLQAMPGTPAASALDDDLMEIFMAQDGATYRERDFAFDALLKQRPAGDWPPRFAELVLRRGEDDRRLVVESIVKGGADQFTEVEIARAALSLLGLLPELGGEATDVDIIGPLYILGRSVERDQIPGILDAFASAQTWNDHDHFERNYSATEFIDTLLDRVVTDCDFTPEQLLAWLQLRNSFSDRSTTHRDALTARLEGDAGLRDRVIHAAVLGRSTEDDHTEQLWRLGQLHPSLRLETPDYVRLLNDSLFAVPGDPSVVERWRSLVGSAGTSSGLPPPVLAAAEPFAAGQPELAEFLASCSQRTVPTWVRREKARQAYYRSKRRRRHEESRRQFSDHSQAIREGDWRWLHQLGAAYLGLYRDLNKDLSARERLTEWLGPALAEDGVVGFANLLTKDDLPSASDLALSYFEGRRWYVVSPLIAGAFEHLQQGRGLGSLREGVVEALAVAVVHESLPQEIEEIIDPAMDAWFKDRPGSYERHLRNLLEQQLASGVAAHELGAVLQRDFGPRAELAEEWLRRFPRMDEHAELQLISALFRLGRIDALRELHRLKEQQGYKDQNHRLRWDAVSFFSDFTDRREQLAKEARRQPDLFWHIRALGWPRRERRDGLDTLTSALAWFVGAFREAFPWAATPRGGWTGDTNPWDASEVIVDAIRRIAADTSEEAAACLRELIHGVSDGYTPYLRNGLAEQQKAARETAFAPPPLTTVAAVLRKAAPQSTSDLRAVVLDCLAFVQSRMGRDDLDQLSLFYENGLPKGEEACRSALAVLMRDILEHGIDLIPERLMPDNKRADIVFQVGTLQLPLEAKGQWHRALWSAAEDQLDALYSIEWRAQGRGIYLVFWFGPNVPRGKQLKGRGGGAPPITDPEDLRRALTNTIPESRRESLEVVVLDVSRQQARTAT